MALNVAAIASLTLEKVMPQVSDLVETDDTLYGLIGDADGGKAIRISPRGYRIPLKYAKPGAYKSISLDGGALPLGGGNSYDNGTVTPQVVGLPIGFTKLTDMVGSKTDQVAVENVVMETLADASDNIKKIMDILLQTDGTGNLGTITGSVTSKVVNMTAAGFGARLLVPGQQVDVYNASNIRTGGTVTVTPASYTQFLGGTQAFTYTESDPSGITSGDIIRVSGLTSGAPVFMYGLAYANSTSTSGTYLGINRTNPYVVANGYSLGSAQVSLPALRLLLNQVIARLGQNAVKSQFWHTHPSQVAAYEELGFERQNFDLAKKNQYPDMLFSGSVVIADLPVYKNVHADNTAWDLIEKKAWGKVRYADGMFWYEIPGMGRIYPIYDSSGAPQTQFGATLVNAIQFFNNNPLAGGRLSSAKVPAGN